LRTLEKLAIHNYLILAIKTDPTVYITPFSFSVVHVCLRRRFCKYWRCM